VAESWVADQGTAGDDVSMSVDVFAFHDLRAYLAAFYAWKKQATPSFSFRAFSKRIDVRSPNHLKRVIDGERNLTDEMARTYARALGLRGEGATYFVDLARFSRAKTLPEREEAWRAMMHSARYRAAHAHDVRFAKYCASWYLPAIRELAACPGFDARPEVVAQQLLPPISRQDAAEAIDTLVELGLLERVDGKVTRGAAVVTTGAETRGLHIRQYHRVMLERAAESMELVPAAERDISAVTLCVSDRNLPSLKAEIAAFRKRLIALAEDDPHPDRVVQFNLQLFPLTKVLP
jgi:uncharacterized protein (TIGR02147 family)